MPRLKPRKLDFNISNQEYAALKKAVSEGRVKTFVDDFNKSHNTQDSDVITLGTMMALENNDVLYIRKIYNALPFDLAIITTENSEGKNLILYALESGYCRTITECMYGLPTEHERYELNDKLIIKIADWVKKTPSLSDIHPTDLIDELLKPVLTEEQTERIITIVGADWLDSYYV